MNKFLIERDCTPKCQSTIHGQQLLSCIPYATPSQMRSFAVWLCNNFASIHNALGRNFLHVATSCGKSEIVEWLVKQCCAEVEGKDLESGWTALHCSFFYGQLAAARILYMNGANMKSTDHEGFTPLDIVMKDRLPYIEYLPSYPSDAYVWGSNVNYNLGLGNSRDRVVPEVLEVFHKAFIDIQQIQICKFHAAFLSLDGRVFTCGYGYGGRLGQDSEDIALEPSLVKGLGNHTCSQIAAGEDHMLLLLENGQIWSCGLNTYHQLGHVPPCERLLTPKPISTKFLKGKVVGLRAAKFHSIVYTKDIIYTFGLNAGQLGHPKGDRTQIHPRQVSTLYTEDCQLSHVETSDGAIVCATTRGEIYVLHEYQIRKIASRQLEIGKLSMVGGHLDSRCNVAGVREGGGLELRVALLTKSGKLYLWRQTDPYLRRCLFASTKEVLLSDIHLNHYTVGLITQENEGYLGTVIDVKGKRPPPPNTNVHAFTSSDGKKSVSGFTKLLNRNDCHIVKVTKLPHIYRGTKITSDSKGKNFAILQANPKMGLIEIPVISDSKMVQDFSNLYLESNPRDDFHDIIIKVDKREFAAHKFILASRSDYFRKHLVEDKTVLSLENTKAEAFEQVLKFIYTNQCDLFLPNYHVPWGLQKESGKNAKSKAQNPVSIVQELSRRLVIHRLAKRLEGVKLVDGKIFIQNFETMPRLSFDHKSLLRFCDVNLISSCGTAFACHKCVLIARLDYFHNMLGVSWIENSQLGNLTLPISSQVMDVLIEYIYTDESNKVTDSENVEFLCHVLMISDQLLVPRLKEICEVSLLKLVSLKNATELLELSSLSNSFQLKKSCMQFICINLAAIVESKSLDVLSDNVMQDLTNYYRNLVPSMQKRQITTTCSSPVDLESLEVEYPVSPESVFQKNRTESTDNKIRPKRQRCRSKNSISKEEDVASSLEDSKRVLNRTIPDGEVKICDPQLTPPKPVEIAVCKTVDKKQGQWVMQCPRKQQMLTLDEIMLTELRLTPLQRKTSQSEMKPIPHLSQKQKKAIEAMKSKEQLVPNSPPDSKNCPWAKLPDPSPPSPSFWESVAKKDFQPSPLSRSLFKESSSPVSISSQTKCEASIASSPPSDIVISLHDIQRDEELKLKRTINCEVKPLHILNIEDQAIEELLELYNAHNNIKEKISVARVQTLEVFSPIWKRKSRS